MQTYHVNIIICDQMQVRRNGAPGMAIGTYRRRWVCGLL